jgi:predicted enzyme related to lactoylglutathione lyase
MMKLGTYELMLNTTYEKPYRPSVPDPVRVKTHDDVSLFFGHDNIDEAYSYLKSKGVLVTEPYFTGYGWHAINFHDPDGYGICIHRPV